MLPLNFTPLNLPDNLVVYLVPSIRLVSDIGHIVPRGSGAQQVMMHAHGVEGVASDFAATVALGFSRTFVRFGNPAA